MWSDKGDGSLIEIFHAPNEIEEAQVVVSKLVKIKETENLSWRDFAILYRSNALSRQLELALMKHAWKQQDGRWIQGLPYEIWGSTEFYERREVKDLCAYLRVIVNPLDQEALLRIINQPRRGIGEESLDAMTSYNRQMQKPLWEVLQGVKAQERELSDLKISSSAMKGLEKLLDLLDESRQRFETGSLTETLKWLIQQIDYVRAINEEVKSQTMRDLKWENVQEFVSSLAEYEKQSKDHSDPSLAGFVANLTLNHQMMNLHQNRGNEDRIKLMTFHSAKGLEFPVCFLVGIEDHIIPHEKSVAETGVEEERRLMYVAITRAKQRLIISMAKNRMRMGKEAASRPSRFLFEIPKS